MSKTLEATVQSPRAFIANANTMRAAGVANMVKGALETVVTSSVAPLIPQIGEIIHATVVPVEWGISTGMVDVGLVGLALLAGGKGIVNLIHGTQDFVLANSQLSPQAVKAQQEAFAAEQALIKESLSKAQEPDYSGYSGMY